MKKATFSALAILMATGLTVTVDAQARERGVNERQQQQRERTTAGVRSGQITRPEARQLNRESRGIERKEQAFRSDGNFSRSERREVNRDLDRHGRHVQQSRHDRDRQGWHGGRDWGHQRGFNQGHQARGTSGIDRMQSRQQAQIRQGIRNGSLTPHEARRLATEQRQIAGLERRYRADGVLTRDERRDLRGELQDANRHIYNQSHDDDRRFGR